MDAFAHCADVVRAHDRDRYVADLFAPQPARRHLLALHAFNAEVGRIRDIVSDPMLGEIRLQWWRDALAGDAGGHPVATALKETAATFSLPVAALERLLDARAFDLYDDQMPGLHDLEGYAGDTASALIQLGAIVLAGGRDPGCAEAAGHAGVAQTITGVMRAFGVHAARGQCYLPADLAASHGFDRASLATRAATPALRSLLAELGAIARWHLSEAIHEIAALDPAVKPAFLPIAILGPMLDRMERTDHDPFSRRAEVSMWRRQWIVWRAARRM
jgi:phytoene synthase